MSDTMSLPKAAAYLGIGRNAIYAHVKAGRIPTINYPDRKQALVTIEALDAFRARHTGTIAGTTEEFHSGQVRENAGHCEASQRMTKRRESELDKVFAR